MHFHRELPVPDREGSHMAALLCRGKGFRIGSHLIYIRGGSL
jgi:hypothetical protein